MALQPRNLLPTYTDHRQYESHPEEATQEVGPNHRLVPLCYVSRSSLRQVTRKGSGNAGAFCGKSRSVRHLLRLSVDGHALAHFVFLGAVELADGIRLHLPSLERHGDLALALAELFLEGAAHERAFDVDVVAFPQLRRGVLAEAIPSISYVEFVFRSLAFA